MGTNISLRAQDGFELSAYATGPDNAARGLLLVHEIFGVNAHIRDVADRFAGQGYKVIAPAMFDRTERGVDLGYSQQEVLRGRALRAVMKDADTIADIEAAAAALGTGSRGIVGYSLGAYVAWLAAIRTRSFGAACGWYGAGIAALRDEKPNCPVLLHFGDQDAAVPMEDVRAVQVARPEIEIYVYAGARHGFGCDARGAFSEPDHKLAQQRTLDFLAKHLV